MLLMHYPLLNQPSLIWDTIKIKDGYISFDTIDGQYSLMFALDEATSINSIDNKDEKVTAAKAQDNWYHKMSK